MPRLSGDDLAELRALHKEMVAHAERDQVRAFFETNGRFRELFVSASGNRKL